MLGKLKRWARDLKRDILALYFAFRDARVPWYAKVLALAIVVYAFSPIDLIPDFIPVLGYLDDLVLLPLGIFAVRAMIPKDLMDEFRAAAILAEPTPRYWAGAVVIVAVWLLAAYLVARALTHSGLR